MCPPSDRTKEAAVIKCSFCELPLACKACGKPFQPRSSEAHIAVYQPDMQVSCPECGKMLTCRECGFVYGEEEDNEIAS